MGTLGIGSAAREVSAGSSYIGELRRTGESGILGNAMSYWGDFLKRSSGETSTAQAVRNPLLAGIGAQKNHFVDPDSYTVGMSDGSVEAGGQISRNSAFREAKRNAGIPNSVQGKKPVEIFDGHKKYIVEHREDKFGRGFHFHGADDIKGSPLEKGRYNQYPGHFPENFDGCTKN